MTHSWPPLTALRAFESAGRHLSFRKAAAELHVTPAAVSHQIKLLEDQVGVQLFHRLPRAIELTEAGRAFLPKLNEGFERLALAVQTVRTFKKSGRLSVSVPPAFAGKWLMPRLQHFIAAYPDVDVRILAGMRQVDARSATQGPTSETERVDEADMEIRFGSGNYPGCRTDKLLTLSFTPLCCPSLMKGRMAPRKPADLLNYRLLHDDLSEVIVGWPCWRDWFATAGVEIAEVDHGLRFSHPTLALEAAIDCAGVVLGARELAAADLAAKRLVAPIGINLEIRPAYYVVTPASRADDPKIAAFRRWLLDEAGKPLPI